MGSPRICIIPNCGKPLRAKGYCPMHLYRHNHGKPLDTPPRASFETINAFYEGLLTTEATDCITWPFKRTNGWPTWSPYVPGRRYASVGRELCHDKYGPPPTPEHEAAHNCGNGHLGCVNPNHLRWATHQENIDDKYEHGTMVHGDAHPVSKLREADIPEIRKRLAAGESQYAVARSFGVSRSAICNIHLGMAWTRSNLS